MHKFLPLMLAMTILAVPLAADGQQPAKLYRIGWLSGVAPTTPEVERFSGAFREGLGERGYMEGQNVAIERRYSEVRAERLSDVAAALAAKAKNSKDYAVVGDFFSKEPYSCMVPENDSKWRDFVNHTFMELIDNGKYFDLYDKWFGERGVVPYPMTDKVRNYMLMQSMPE